MGEPPEPPATEPVGTVSDPIHELRAGWLTALGWGVAAAAGALILAEAVVFLALAAAGRGGPSVVMTAKLGDVLFLWFHHAGMVFETRGRAFAPALGTGLSFSFTLALAVLGGTCLAVWLLARGGGAVARASRSTGGAADAASKPPLVAGFHGMKVALPYAGVCLAASAAARFSVRLGANPIIPPELSVQPRYLTVLGWSLALGAVAGFAGGVRASGRGRPDDAPRDRFVRGALSGGARMLALGLMGSFVGLLVLGAVHPDLTRRYFDSAYGRGALRGTTLVVGNVLLAPNMAAWVLFPSMGSCVGLQGSRSDCVLSYAHFPGGREGSRFGGPFGRLLPAARAGAAPAGYLLFLLIPVVAVVLGGVRAAARARARTRVEAAGAGAAAGVVFAGLCLVLVTLASITGTVGVGLGRSAASTFRLGPEPVTSVLLSLLWGVAGGTLGGLSRGPEPVGRRRLVEGATEPATAPNPAP
jgi:hypothetical protein